MKGLTDRQQEVLVFIQGFITAKGCSPSYRDVAAQFEFSVRAAWDHCAALYRKGYLKRNTRYHWRDMTPTGKVIS